MVDQAASGGRSEDNAAARPATPEPEPRAGAAAARRSGGRVARNRQRRTDAFLLAGLRIVVDEGFEALTMARLADELDVAIGAAYHYFPSKGHLLTSIQLRAIERLAVSHDESIDPVVGAVVERTNDDPSLVRLVVTGRWFCAAADVLPAEVRLLQMINVRRSSVLQADGGDLVLPSAMDLLQRIATTVDAALSAGVIRPGSPLARAVAWGSALGGVLATDDLGRYLPDVVGSGQLARQVNVDLCIGWGADAEAVERIDRAVDDVAGSVVLARANGEASAVSSSP